jgi:hypothetical protein
MVTAREIRNISRRPSFGDFWYYPPVLRIHDILEMPLTNGSGFGSDPSIFNNDLQDASKKLIFLKVLPHITFKGTFTSFFKKTVKIKVFLAIFA